LNNNASTDLGSKGICKVDQQLSLQSMPLVYSSYLFNAKLNSATNFTRFIQTTRVKKLIQISNFTFLPIAANSTNFKEIAEEDHLLITWFTNN